MGRIGKDVQVTYAHRYICILDYLVDIFVAGVPRPGGRGRGLVYCLRTYKKGT